MMKIHTVAGVFSFLFVALLAVGPAEPEEHGPEEHQDVVQLTPEQVEKSGIVMANAGPGELTSGLVLPGEIRLNADRVAHVVPRIPGVVREVFKNLGDEVKAGETMAVLDSRDLAILKAAYLAAKERESLASATYTREKGLWDKKISAEQDYLSAKNALAEARIGVRSAEQQLHAIGFSEKYVETLGNQPHTSLTRYEILAPFDGVIIEKHITLGEALKDDATAFVVADLSSVWSDFNVYQKDLGSVRKGQAITIKDGAAQEVTGTISYIGPVMGEETRTAIARAVLENTDQRWRPGQFVTGTMATERLPIAILVPKNAIQTVEGKPVAFVQDADGFRPVPVAVGRSNESHVEISEGLSAGQRYVAEGSFLLKATLEKGELGHDH